MSGRELWYRSPIRESDSTPSFKVDVFKNLWYDHGAAKGGNMLDLVIELHRLSIRDALEHLERTGLYSPYTQSQLPRSPAARNPSNLSIQGDAHGTKQDTADGKASVSTAKGQLAGEKEKTWSLELLDSQPLKHPALLQYLEKRGIDPKVACKYASQIDFKRPQSASRYFALGYPAGDGYEARNALFKGFVGSRKDVTFHSKLDSPLLLVFEGFMDFLTYLTIKKLEDAPGSVLVLNSGNLKARALPYIQDARYSEIQLFLDNDEMGDAVTAYFLERGDSAKIQDMRHHYAQHDDLNAWHMARKP